MKSEWIGDFQNGVEVRRHGDDIDEVLLFVRGEPVVHLEYMTDQHVWIGLNFPTKDAPDNRVSVNITSRGNIKTTAERDQ
jgi:hypothetical protein